MRVTIRPAWFLGLVLVSSCSSKANNAPPQIGDCDNPSCAEPHGGGGISSGTGGGATDAAVDSVAEAASPAPIVDVTFVVGATREGDPAFQKPTETWPDLVKVSAFGASGTFVSTNAGVASGSVLEGVRAGANWFAVQDVSGKPKGFTATLEPASVDPMIKTVSLIALRTSGLTSTFIDAVPWAPVAATATLLLEFTQKSKPLRNVSIGGVPAGAKIAYDTGVLGAYSMTTDPITDAAGAVLVDQIPVAAAFPEFNRTTLQAAVGGKTFSFEVVIAQGFVTWMVVDIPAS